MTASLIEKLEGAGEGSRELDYAIRAVVETFDDYWALRVPADWTTSLDAALALAERVLPGWRRTVEELSCGQWMSVVTGKKPEPHLSLPLHVARAATPALALCAAILRASSKGEGHE